MGIESDQLVFDYLSRVGDLAQQRQLPSQTRMRLVSSLRAEIDTRRAKDDSPAAVRGILTALGTPDEVVGAAASGGGGPARPAVPVQRTPRTRFRRRPEAPDVPPAAAESWSPHLAGMDEAGASVEQPDWWRVEEGAFGQEGAFGGPGAFGGDILPPGFRGGVEIPDMLKPPPKPDETAAEPATEPAAEPAQDAPEAPPAPAPSRRRVPLPRLRLGHPMLVAAAVLLVVGVALGSWLALGGGWLLAYATGRLSRAEAKLAVFGLPGAVAAGAAVWLWGRLDGRWGDPIPPGGDAMSAALAGTWPWTLRTAALASALYLLWRARRA
ncbi:hypothetical protein [Streptomyces sp. CB03238]|uniref:hypothetical protein n=1 Tax=Streptomyces sp. CB03238 TaxID=1907777 RepID=UPI000A10EA89|nr:hypothetical protein [Streptomyces sp. CB03238]ORT58962.1 hypothetical protein BKD26_16660 [Streptomyces sp. CB03238]